MMIHISTRNGVPIYLQIVQQIRHQIASGRLRPGDELPPIRTLAQQLVINPNTVARAYRELESAGLITSKVGAGSRIAEGVSPLARRERMRILNEVIDGLLAEAHQLNFSDDEVVEALQQRAHGMREPVAEEETDHD